MCIVLDAMRTPETMPFVRSRRTLIHLKLPGSPRRWRLEPLIGQTLVHETGHQLEMRYHGGPVTSARSARCPDLWE